MYKDGDNWIKLDTNIKGRSITAKTNQGGVYAVFYDSEAPPPIPEKFELVSLYPNPFNPYLNIKYNLDIQENVSIVIYNLLVVTCYNYLFVYSPTVIALMDKACISVLIISLNTP